MPRKHALSFSGAEYKQLSTTSLISPRLFRKKRKPKPEAQSILNPSISPEVETRASEPKAVERRSTIAGTSTRKARVSSWKHFEDSDETKGCFDSGINSAEDESRNRVELFVNDVKCDFTIGEYKLSASSDDVDRVSYCSELSDESVFADPGSPDVVVAERFGHQLSPVSSERPRSGSVGTVEVSASIRDNPFFLQDKNLRDRNVKAPNRRKNSCGIYNLSLVDDHENGFHDGFKPVADEQWNGSRSPKVVVHESPEEKLEIEFLIGPDGNNNDNKARRIVQHCPSPSQYSTELLNWYLDSPSHGKSASLPRRIPPPPASPRTRKRLPTTPTANKVTFLSDKETTSFDQEGSGHKRNQPGIHRVRNSRIRDISNGPSGTRIRSVPNSPGYSPSKSATLPPSHKLTPKRGNGHHHSFNDKHPRSQPSSPQGSVRRAKSLLSSPSLQKRSPSFGKKAGSYKNLGVSFDENTKPEEGDKIQRSQSTASAKHKSSLQVPQDGSTNHKRKVWKPANREMMTNYEGYYAEESSDGEVTESTSGGTERHDKSFDSVVFDVLKVPPEDFASQLTLLDLTAFCEIKPMELTGCGWIKKDKVETSPNVVQMTQRFNNTSFYIIHEILHAQTLKMRSEILMHFIRIAKKLHDLNNLHSLMAVVSSLTSSSIFRLSKTWALVNKHHKATFDRLRCLMSEDSNRVNLRKHMEGIRLPCIPYLGMYLADLIFVDSAHPDTGGLESHERTNKMNNILRILAEFQQSNYDHLREIPHIKTFLQSVKYIEELQKFVEDENYKRSLKIEPNQSATPQKGLSSSREELTVGYDNSLPRRSMTPPSQQLFKPGHRKSHSLGRDIRPRTDPAKIHKRRSFYGRMKSRESSICNGSSPAPQMALHRVYSSPDASGSLPRSTAHPSHLTVALTTSLLDDSIISPGATLPPPTVPSNSGSIGSSRSNSGSEFSDDTSWSGFNCSEGRLELGRCQFEGCIRRKTVLKHGKKPPMSSWTKYWVSLHDSQLVFYQAKSLRASEKSHFKRSPCKMISLPEWMVLCSDDPAKLDSFQLSNPNQGDIYRFQTDCKDVAVVWVRRLQEAIKGNSPPEKDLINLEDT